jgi:hypothetical protein
MKHNRSHIVFWEMVLLAGSVPVFRGLWMIFDDFKFMNSIEGITLSLAAGIVLCIIALLALNKHEKETEDRKES